MASIVLSDHTLPLQGLVVQKYLARAKLGLSDVVFLCGSGGESTDTASYCDALVVASTTPATTNILARAARLLKPGSPVTVAVSAEQGETLETVKSTLITCGFVQPEQVQDEADASYSYVQARKPDYELGSKQPLKSLQPKPVQPQPNVWVVSTNDEEDELLDDEDLLTEEDKKRPAPSADDCEVGKAGRKACKNCSCGRAEAEAGVKPVKLTQEMLENPVSSCGNCALGDAFRCSGCPYRGLPKFEPGKKIQLSANFLVADV